jgi:hypothetical protein
MGRAWLLVMSYEMGLRYVRSRIFLWYLKFRGVKSAFADCDQGVMSLIFDRHRIAISMYFIFE